MAARDEAARTPAAFQYPTTCSQRQLPIACSKPERGVTVTQQVLRATSELARAHGATPLLVVLQFGHEAQPDQMLRRRILDNASIPYVLVEIDSSWRLPWDRHPNARAARAIATAIESELRGRLTVAGPIK